MRMVLHKAISGLMACAAAQWALIRSIVGNLRCIIFRKALDRGNDLCYIPLRLQRFAAGDFDGRIAQLVEQLTLNQRVLGSSPSAPTIEIPKKF